MANTSATGGYLTPGGSALLRDEVLEDALQAHVVGITDLPGFMVRPRWQPTVPEMPEPDQNWAAIGVKLTRADDGPVLEQQEEFTRYIRHETMDVLVTFYGPSGFEYASLFRDGLAIPQNNQPLSAIKAKLISTGDILAIPELVNQQFIRRYDLPFTIRRKVERTYQIKPFNSPPVISVTGD